MTHSLHRTGSVEDLKGDFVFIIRIASGFDKDALAPKMRRMAEILASLKPCNMGSTDLGGTMAAGLSTEELVERAWGARGVYCAFTTREQAKEALRQIKEADLGLCVTVSGLINEVFAIGSEIGLPPHTINQSLGVMGKTELLPEQDLLDLTTMCGHATVSTALTRKVVDDYVSGRITVEQAVSILGEPCVCGIFNLERAKRKLSAISGQQSAISSQL